MRPKGILLDYGGTLVQEVGYDPRAGHEALLRLASHRPSGLTIERVMERDRMISRALSERRDELGIEMPWPSIARLIYDFFGVRFDLPASELELAFWNASVTTAAMPGAREASIEIHRCGIPTAVVSNSSFGAHVLRHELDKHGLAAHLAFVMVSADYVVRKPKALLFETAAARLGVPPDDTWFIGNRPDTDMAGARAAGMKPVWLNASHDNDVDGVYFAAASWNEILRRFRHGA